MEGGAGPAKRIKVEGGWSGQPETALLAGDASCLFCVCSVLPITARPCSRAPAMLARMRVIAQLLGIWHCIPLLMFGTGSNVGWSAGTSIKPESSAALPDDGVPVQTVKQSTPLTDALNGADGGTAPLSFCNDITLLQCMAHPNILLVQDCKV